MKKATALTAVFTATVLLMSVGVGAQAIPTPEQLQAGRMILPSSATTGLPVRDGCSISMPIHIQSATRINVYIGDDSGLMASFEWSAQEPGDKTLTWRITRPMIGGGWIDLDLNGNPVSYRTFGYPNEVAVACQALAAKTPRPINCLNSKIFVAQGEDATTLRVKEYDATSGVNSTRASFVAAGAPWAGTDYTTRYNAIAYNDRDGYIYGLADAESGGVELVVVGDQGAVQRLGDVKGLPTDQSFRNNGAFLNGTYYFTSDYTNVVYSLDLNTLQATRISLSQTWEPADFVDIDGYLWGILDWDIYRLDVTTGQVSKFRIGNLIGGRSYGAGGAVFRYTNGDFGVISSDIGMETQIHISNPGDNNPTFSLVGQTQAPTSSRNDATSCGNRLYS